MIYRESERNAAAVQPVRATQEGMDIYHASESQRRVAPVRLFNGKPFDAYQRSEWLGEER